MFRFIMNIITFISDFGGKDWFVSAVKGEILKLNPEAKIIDITHNLEPFDIKQAAFILKMVYKNFPKGTIHLAVVDPGVGSGRKPLIVFSDDHYFVGPDNGIFSYIYNNNSVVYEIIVKKKVSCTFHARDIFGPVAGKISLGIDLNKLGKIISKFQKFSFPQIRHKKNRVYGEIVYVDHFGNLITNIPIKFALKKIYIERFKIIPVKKFYALGKTGEVFGVRGSSNFYEIACFKERADERLKIKVGHKVVGIL